MTADRLARAVLATSWLALPFTTGDALAGALDGRSVAVRAVASAIAWAAWALVLPALLVPHPAGLTAVRLVAPFAVAVAGWAAIEGDVTALSVVVPVLACVAAFAPETAMWAVNGPAYPNERRFPLRAPAALVAGPVPLAAALVGAGVCAAPLLMAARQWLLGATALVVGVPVVVVLVRSLHGLSRRWAVFVPAGLVLHDPLALADPVLFRRELVRSLGPAPADSQAHDLTQHAFGLALELGFAEPVPLVLARVRRAVGEQVEADAVLFTPSRPGALLAEAARRRLGGPRPSGSREPEEPGRRRT